MAEERTLGLARASEQFGEEPSKEELQRRLEEARDSISNTVTEIKDNVASQVQMVKDTLDWREQFRRRPVAWTVGALGTGFFVGYGLAAMLKGEDSDRGSQPDYYSTQGSRASQSLSASGRSPIAQPVLGEADANPEDEGPGIFQRIADTPAYGRVRAEAGTIGDAVVKELSNTAKQLIIPAFINSLRSFLGSHLPGNADVQAKSVERNATKREGVYEPHLERQ